MNNQSESSGKPVKRLTAAGALFLSFVVALEIVIMISPFAVFFYAAFNPFLLTLHQSSLTRWMTAFFLPHMVVPPNELLVTIRILGSIVFAAGLLVFVVCAAQVYLGKLLKKGTATGGLYALVRHPQYVGLALAAAGLAIMWPRFLTLVLLSIMLILYYVLARDEERRMANRFGDDYLAYKKRTGMFLPRSVETFFAKSAESESAARPARVAGVFVLICLVIVGMGFAARTYTIHHLPIQQLRGVDVLTITPDDTVTAAELVPPVLDDSLVASRLTPFLGKHDRRILAYFLPINYVMQGMIANTGDDWKLFQQHKTFSMIADYVLHPFAHLTGGHMHNMAGMQHGPEMYAMPAMKRRIIFLEVGGNGDELLSPYDDFDVNVQRTPLFFVDVHLHTAEILQVHDTPTGSGWGTVPTPMF